MAEAGVSSPFNCIAHRTYMSLTIAFIEMVHHLFHYFQLLTISIKQKNSLEREIKTGHTFHYLLCLTALLALLT